MGFPHEALSVQLLPDARIRARNHSALIAAAISSKTFILNQILCVVLTGML